MRTPIDTYSGVVEVSAGCECGWSSDAKNALGNAKRHAAAHGHVVTVLQQVSVTYAPAGTSREEMLAKRHLGQAAMDGVDEGWLP